MFLHFLKSYHYIRSVLKITSSTTIRITKQSRHVSPIHYFVRMDLVCPYFINSLPSLQIIQSPTQIPGHENIFWVQVINHPIHSIKMFLIPTSITKKSEWSILKSTGGEVDNNKSHPGVAIYFKGADIGAVVSTGNWTWKVEVQGQRPLPGKWQSYAYLVIHLYY